MGFIDIHSDAECEVKPIIDHRNTNYLDVGSLEVHNIAWIISGVCVALACCFSFYLIFRHLSNYTNSAHQKHVVRIILMVPIYGIDSFLSFRFYWVATYFNVLRDCYEAFVIYTFYSLLIEYVGGYALGKEMFANKPPFKLALPLCCIVVTPKRGLLRQCKRLTLQYVVIRPLMTIISVILQSQGEFCPGNYSPLHGYFYVSVVNFFSVTIAMYALVQFYSVSKHEIAKYRPILKFLSVKFVIFLSFWQSIIVGLFVLIHGIEETTYWSTANISEGVQSALLCGEMLIAAIVHVWAFSWKDFDTGKRTPVLKSAADCFSPQDIYQDIYLSFFPKKASGYKEAKEEAKSIVTESDAVGLQANRSDDTFSV